MVKYSDGSQHQTKINLLKKVLNIVTSVLLNDHEVGLGSLIGRVHCVLGSDWVLSVFQFSLSLNSDTGTAAQVCKAFQRVSKCKSIIRVNFFSCVARASTPSPTTAS